MTTAYITSIPVLLYSLGISDAQIKKIVAVKILNDSNRAGIRPFKVASSTIEDICCILKIEFEEKDIEDLNRQRIKFNDGDLIDCQIIYRLDKLPRTRKLKVLALQHEYVNFKRPSFFKGYSPSLRKRIDLLTKIVFPFKLFTYYGLALSPKPYGFIKELPVNHHLVQKYRQLIFKGLLEKQKYQVLKALRDQNKDKSICVVFPFAKHWGGSDELNKKLFEVVTREFNKGGLDRIIIKNHPSDPQNYAEIIPEEMKRIQPTILSEVIDRTIPIELVVEAFGAYRFIGTESTAFMTLAPFVSSPTIIVDSELQISKRYQEYVSGETRGQYENLTITIY